MRIFVVGMGVVSPLGIGVASFRAALTSGAAALGPVTLFTEALPLPVGQVPHAMAVGALPRTHAMALMAAREALADAAEPVDAVVLGGTTGGMLTTETQLEAGECRPERFRYHGTGTVAEVLARECSCPGPAITVSTACSSGAAAIKIALEFLRAGRGRRVLAGGADSLCRLTYYGFHALQLIDPEGARPFDRDRRGMCVGEGAALLLLAAAETPPPNALAEVLGGGLSCDAFHPTAPHPEGAGAVRAIRAALSDAGVAPAEIGYIHLHGTGTSDNDRSEARALNAVFGLSGPPASSLKGAMGHPLAAAGAMGAAASVLCVSEGLIPANTGCRVQDPEIRLALADAPLRRSVQTALSNSFGFGGNNAALVFGAARNAAGRTGKSRNLPPLRVGAAACLTGAGFMGPSLERLGRGEGCAGTLSTEEISRDLPQRGVRRLKRLSRMALSLAAAARDAAGREASPEAVFWGTGWGPLSETHDFLDQLSASRHRFASPTDFVGSLHNAPAGHVAAHFNARGPSITATGGDASFEQALLCASLMAHEIDGPFLVLGADEAHPRFTPLFDPSAALAKRPSDGGGALWVLGMEDTGGSDVRVRPAVLAPAEDFHPADMVTALGGPARLRSDFAAVFAGIPAACRECGAACLKEFLSVSGFDGPVLDFRRQIGEFATASAAAVAVAVEACRRKTILAPPDIPAPLSLESRGILVLGFGACLSAVEVLP